MFYLVAFVSLAVGVLFYMFNPLPVGVREDMDVKRSEAFVVSFLNQHQAARDFVEYWLGRVHPGESYDGSKYLAGTQTADKSSDFKNQSSSSTLENPNAAVIALPGGINNKTITTNGIVGFFPPQFEDERVALEDVDTNSSVGLLKKGNEQGYVSAFVCMNADKTKLVPCYTAASLSKLEVNPQNKHQFVITYGVQPGITEDMTDAAKGSFSRQEKQQLWKRALLTRSHASENCGFLMRAPGGYKWSYTPKKKGNKVDFPGSYKYCINNGNQCQNVVPQALEGYLEKAILGSSSVDADLTNYLFCISEARNPYDRISPTAYHYDGIDACALGGGVRPECASWTPVRGASTTDLSNYNKQWPNTPGVAFNDSNSIVMPFQQKNEDYSVSFIWDVGEYTSTTTETLFSVQDPDHATGEVSLDITQNAKFQKEFLLKGDDGSSPAQLEISLEPEESVLPTKYAVTLIRREAGTYIVINGCRGLMGADTSYVQGAPVSGSDPEDLNIAFGPVGTTKLLDVRYYDHALTAYELRENFKSDMKRYGVVPLQCLQKRNLAELPNRGYLE